MKRTVDIIRVSPYETSYKKDIVACEMSLPLWINNNFIFCFDCSPSHLKELIIGFLLSEGWIKREDEILNLKINSERAEVYLKTQKKYELNPLKKTVDLPSENIWSLMHKIEERSSLFKETAGFHAAALVTAETIIYFFEDISRHSAVDKVIGRAFLDGYDFKDKRLLTTCRLTARIAKKTIQTGIPVLISKCAVTDNAIELANAFNLTLIGFVRNEKINVYNKV